MTSIWSFFDTKQNNPVCTSFSKIFNEDVKVKMFNYFMLVFG